MERLVVSGNGGSPIGSIGAADRDAELIGLWLHGRSPHTQRAYRADVRRFLCFAGKGLHQATLADLQAFADALAREVAAPAEGTLVGPPSVSDPETAPRPPLCAASRARILSSVKSVLAFGHRLGLLPVDVGAALRLPGLRSRLAERILPEPDVQRMLALEPGARNRALLRLLYAAGLRVSEICGLCWRDLSERGDAGQVSVLGKGGKTRTVLLSPATWHELRQLRASGAGEPQGPVFRSRTKGGHLDPSQVLRIVRAAAKRAGLETNVSPHWMRHAHASHALDRGAPIHLVQQTLGHASVATTGRYLHARPNDSSARYLGV